MSQRGRDGFGLERPERIVSPIALDDRQNPIRPVGARRETLVFLPNLWRHHIIVHVQRRSFDGTNASQATRLTRPAVCLNSDAGGSTMTRCGGGRFFPLFARFF